MMEGLLEGGWSERVNTLLMNETSEMVDKRPSPSPWTGARFGLSDISGASLGKMRIGAGLERTKCLGYERSVSCAGLV